MSLEDFVRRGVAAQKAVDALGAGARICAWCREPLTTARGRFCGKVHRQAAWRLRSAGPPQPMARAGRSRRAVFAELGEAGGVHHRLIARLRRSDGWALACAPVALRWVLPRVAARGGRDGVTVAAWCLDGGPWEAVVVKRARPRPAPAVSVRVPAADARSPLWGAWVVRLLGILPGDELAELGALGGPVAGGAGVVSRAFNELATPPRPPPPQLNRQNRKRPKKRPAARSRTPGPMVAGGMARGGYEDTPAPTVDIILPPGAALWAPGSAGYRWAMGEGE